MTHVSPRTRVATVFGIAISALVSVRHSESADDHHSLELSDEVIPYEELGEGFIERPKPVTELIEDIVFPQNRERDALLEERNEGNPDIVVPPRKTIFGDNPFLGLGAITPGVETPTGAIWQPSLIIFGEFRSAVQTFNDGENEISQWSNRFDLFANYYLTPTERLFLGVRPLDDEGRFTGYNFGGDRGSGGEEAFNFELRSLYFEGDFGELFPRLDPNDSGHLDYGFSIGRQAVNFQDGIMINDSIDAVGITRSSLFLLGSSATRITAMFGLNQIHRGDNVRDRNAQIYGLFLSSDYEKSTYDVDLAYVDGSQKTGGDGVYLGLAQTRRFGRINSTLRANFSWALDEGSSAVDDGILLTAQLSRTPTWNHDLIYLNAFVGIDNYTSAARDPSVGGPLGNMGILYAAVGLGDYGAALGNRAEDAIGFGLGYQHFFDEAKRRQLIGEIGGRLSTSGANDDAVAIGAQYQRVLNDNTILVLGGAGSYHEERGAGYGARLEMRFKF